MAISAAITHVTRYTYDHPISIGPQTIRLRPAPHCRTPVTAYSLKVEPAEHFSTGSRTRSATGWRGSSFRKRRAN